MKVTDEMVSRFLGWRLPENFSPDAGISFKASYNEGTPWGGNKHEPTGTNLFDADQTREMLEYVLDGSAPSPAPSAQDGTLRVFVPQEEFCKGGLCDQVFIGEPACEAGECWAKECARSATPQPPVAEPPDMLAICAALGFDPTNHHNAAKCPYCRPHLAVAEPSADVVREALAELVACSDLARANYVSMAEFKVAYDMYAKRWGPALGAARAALAASSKELAGKPSCRDSGIGWCEIQHIDGGKFCDGGQCLKYKYDGSLKEKP